MARLPQRIGVLTGGGDCPGLNAVIRAVTKEALLCGSEVLGIEDGFLGLIEDHIRPLLDSEVSNILTQGGTILGSSNKANPSHYATGKDDAGQPVFEDVSERCLQNLKTHGIEALVVIGGDGTMTCAAPFERKGVRCIGVPKTIDNDIHGTELSFGFLTAMNTATEALDKVHTTAASHHRALVVEVMGRNAGWIALHAGVASGSDVILLPELPFDHDAICAHVRRREEAGKRFSIVCVSEGARPEGGDQVVERTVANSPDPIRLGGVGKTVADTIEQCTGIESRAIVLGHVQRGGSPAPVDRLLGTAFGHRALCLLREGASNRMVAMQGGALTDIDIAEVADKQRLVPLDHPLIQSARAIGTCMGDGGEARGGDVRGGQTQD